MTPDEKYLEYLEKNKVLCKCGTPMLNLGRSNEYHCPKCNRLLFVYRDSQEWYRLEDTETAAELVEKLANLGKVRSTVFAPSNTAWGGEVEITLPDSVLLVDVG